MASFPGDPLDPFGIPPDPVPQWTGPVPFPPEWDLPMYDVPAPPGAPGPAPLEAPVGALPPEPMPQDAAQAMPPDPGIPLPDAVSAPDALPELAPTQAVPEKPLEYIDDARELAGRSAEDVALYDSNLEGERSELGRLEKAKSIKADREKLEDNERIYQEAQAKTAADVAALQAESKALADQKGGFAGLSTGQRLGGIIAAVFGGLLQGKTGSATNSGLEMVNRLVEQEAADRQAKMANVKDRLATATAGYARNADTFRHAEVFRQAAYEQAAREVETQMAAFDPQGTTAVRGAKLVQQIRGQAAAAKAKFEAEQHERNLKDEEQKLKVRKQETDERQHKETTGLGYSRLAFDKTKDGRDYDLKKREVEAKEEENRVKRADALAKADRELGIGGEMRGKTVKQKVADPVTGKLVEKDVTVYEADRLRNADDSVFHAPSEIAQQGLVKQRGGTQDLIDALGELKLLRKSAGGADKYTDPGQQAEYERLTNKAVIAYATSKGLSLADKQSTDFARGAIIGSDPSNYRAGDVERRIEASIQDATRSYHTALKGQGYTGKLPSFEKRQAPAALSSPEEATKTIEKGKTPLEHAQGEGVLRRVEEHAGTAKSSGDVAIPGLAGEQATAAKELLKTAKSTQHDERTVNDARQQLVNLATNPKREALHSPVLKLLEDEAPDLFDAAVEKLPKEERDYWTGYAKIRRRGQ